jgi:predicted neutral ceramidase superfamily lipid hydrolase
MNKPASEAHNTKALTCAKDLWLGTCARYTVLCLILLLASAIASDSLTVTYVDTVSFFLQLPFGFCLTLAAWVRRSDKLSAGVKVGLHALATLGGFYLCGYLPYQLRTKPSGMQVLIILLAAVILYAVVMAVITAVSAKSRQKQIDAEPYESRYRK